MHQKCQLISHTSHQSQTITAPIDFNVEHFKLLRCCYTYLDQFVIYKVYVRKGKMCALYILIWKDTTKKNVFCKPLIYKIYFCKSPEYQVWLLFVHLPIRKKRATNVDRNLCSPELSNFYHILYLKYSRDNELRNMFFCWTCVFL